ncbi:MAG: metallophosphoesterase family protein [Candidatus Omnitrophica bacterium]|nr:metallophosphoesterase family protein [Candidatus Omnitrophota bacterium]
MRYGVISDIHGNLEALEVVADALADENIDKILCPGDIVGYGANPAECIKILTGLNTIVVCGNHDAGSVGLSDINCFNEAARIAVLWTRKTLTESDIIYLKNLEFVYKDRSITLVHGTLQEPEEFHYMLDEKAARATFDLMDTTVCFIGHSHVPGAFIYRKNRADYTNAEIIKVRNAEKVIINAGSVGQPRDGNPSLCYCVYDTDKERITFKRLPYNVPKAQGKILKAGLPHFLAHRLSQGV